MVFDASHTFTNNLKAVYLSSRSHSWIGMLRPSWKRYPRSTDGEEYSSGPCAGATGERRSAGFSEVFLKSLILQILNYTACWQIGSQVVVVVKVREEICAIIFDEEERRLEEKCWSMRMAF